MKKLSFIAISVLLISILAFVGCNDDKNSRENETTRVEIRLTDAPAPYDAVNINIKAVSLHINSDWIELDLLEPGIFNLLDFQNGIDVLLINEEVPIGKISQIRLILDDEGNSIVKDGMEYGLKIPSGEESGLKLNLHDELVSNVVYKLWLDFDATRSIVETGSGKFQLKPVIRTYTDATSGSIKGYVLPKEANAAVWAILDTDSILTYPRINDGYFLITGLQPNSSWKIVLDPDVSSGYKKIELVDVSIQVEQVNDLGRIVLEKK